MKINREKNGLTMSRSDIFSPFIFPYLENPVHFFPFPLKWRKAARDLWKARSAGAEYRTGVDRAHHTVAAVDWSLPSETRLGLR